ncbi:MAG TPA: hypothetical protein VGI22_14855 [Xanthobacteraceae bacterium]
MKLKRLLLASAVLGLAGTIGTANAATISATSVEIWNADTTGGQFGPASQAFPTNPLAAGAPVAALTATTDPLNFNDGGTDTIGGFFSGTTLPGTCNSTCAADVLSSGNFSHATLFRFTFNEAINETFTVTHDDGVSLFADGSLVNLLPGEADPSTSETQSVDITPGNYVLWYEEVNGLPAILQATSTPLAATPLPAALPMFATGLLGFWGWRRKRRAA